ncbi:MAG: exonuclease SbcCD subunit D [Clostridia bacterium]|nr:exonuclease SbcCD subunit D [Clostridia bacterium]
MKFLHLSDIHLGKALNRLSLMEDQAEILRQMHTMAARDDVDAVLIAGDVYNRAQPQPEAISAFSAFLTDLAALGKPVCVVRGNHDGEAQLSYAEPLLRAQGIYLTPPYDGSVRFVDLSDAFGPLRVHLLPYVRPIQVRRALNDDSISTYEQAVAAALSRAQLLPEGRNVLVTHQYVTGAQLSDSEERPVGGLDQVSRQVFAAFDFVALGHLHRAQTLDGGRIRYSGAPLVYSFDECGQTKSASLVEVGPKGAPNRFEALEFQPLRRVCVLTGTLEELCALPRSEDYIQAVLTDAERLLDPFGALRVNFPDLLALRQSGGATDGEGGSTIEETFEPALSPEEHFSRFFEARNGVLPSAAQMEWIAQVVREVTNE